MADAPRDQNRIPVMQGVLNTDGETPTNVEGSPISHSIEVDDNTTGSDNGPASARRDQNRVTSAMCVSSADGESLVALYVNSSGQLLIDSS